MAKELISTHLDKLKNCDDDTVKEMPCSQKHLHVEVKSQKLMEKKPSQENLKQKLALVLDGKTVGFVMNDDIKEKFLLLAQQCHSVLCCRATPNQKVRKIEKHR